MSVTENQSNGMPPATKRWRLWVDGCGGFLLLGGSSWTVGCAAAEDSVDISAGADWPRLAGTIHRLGESYVWMSTESDQPMQLRSGQRVPISGSASMIMMQPSPLTPSAVLQLNPPHRFCGHVDAVILADQTLLVGPTTDCHGRGSMLKETIVLSQHLGQWNAKIRGQRESNLLVPNERVKLGDVAILLELA